jgi:ATP-dependent DNA ligase
MQTKDTGQVIKFSTLYKRNSNGKTQQWTIYSAETGYYTEEGIVGGRITTSSIHTVEAKNVGKANETTVAQQSTKEAAAEFEKKLKRGYIADVEAIDSVSFKKPMKGDKWKDRADEVKYPVIVQDKLNGIRCQNNSVSALSTGGEIFYTIPHIREALKPIFDKYPNAFIDGEAFNYDLRSNLNRLVKIVSVVIKAKDLTPELLEESRKIVQLHVFDGWGFENITHNTPYAERHEAVTKLITNIGSPCLKVLKSEVVEDLETLIKKLAINKRSKGEGLMVRWGNCEYKHGRSKYLLKLKHFEDAEFEILDIQEGNADWKDCAKRIILKLPQPSTTGEETFASNIEGDREWLRELYKQRKKIIGKQATVEYQCLSEYGVPQLPWVRAIRDYE